MTCAHYGGGETRLRRPLIGERFLSAKCRTCVCDCGVCLGWITRTGTIAYNPILSDEQRYAVAVFLVGRRKAYQHRYYESVTKPKRAARRTARGVESPRADPEDLQRAE